VRVYLICPVRGATTQHEERLKAYTSRLRSDGHEVFYPARENAAAETDPFGAAVCSEDCTAMRLADEVHVYWDSESKGSLFDLGMAFALGKPLVLLTAGLGRVPDYCDSCGASFEKTMLK
jgi:nucleoside 2-deoxyribosyltransferase